VWGEDMIVMYVCVYACVCVFVCRETLVWL
jgi:hypothetical protein